MLDNRFYQVCLLLLILALPVSLLAQPEDDEPVVRAILFHSPTCPYCRIVIEQILPPIRETYGDSLEIRFFDLSIPADYQVFAALHEQIPNLPGGIPQLYIDQYVLVGTDQIEQGLPIVVDDCLERGGCDYPFRVEQETPAEEAASSAAEEAAPSAAAAAEPVYVAYCFDPTCPECSRVEYDLEHLQAQYPHLVIRHFNIRDDAALIEAMCEHYDVPSEERLVAPSIFIGSVYLPAEEITLTRLTSLIEAPETASAPPPWEALDAAALQAATGSMIERFERFSIPAVAAAGLLDGINPCAFTTIIFFLSYLTLVGREKHELLLVGGAFTLAVFLSYLALGLGLSALVEQIGAVGTIGKIIYGATAVICLTLAVLSLVDFVRVRRGQTNEMILQLPKALKKSIHGAIRSRSRMKGYITAAFVTGALVSVFELACTGQVYLPTIVFMTGVAEMRSTAIAYLTLYNAMFIVPLIVVFIVAYFGVSSQKLTVFFQAHVGAIKLLTTGLFALLGVWLVLMMLT